MIVAGAGGDEQTFAVYRWSGNVKDDPVDTAVGWLAGFNLEALFAIPGRAAVQVLSDDGKLKIEGTRCEDWPPDRQRFRSFDLVREEPLGREAASAGSVTGRKSSLSIHATTSMRSSLTPFQLSTLL